MDCILDYLHGCKSSKNIRLKKPLKFFLPNNIKAIP